MVFQGDSGGPLVQKGGKWIKAVGDKWIQVIIVNVEFKIVKIWSVITIHDLS